MCNHSGGVPRRVRPSQTPSGRDHSFAASAVGEQRFNHLGKILDAPSPDGGAGFNQNACIALFLAGQWFAEHQRNLRHQRLGRA